MSAVGPNLVQSAWVGWGWEWGGIYGQKVQRSQRNFSRQTGVLAALRRAAAAVM